MENREYTDTDGTYSNGAPVKPGYPGLANGNGAMNGNGSYPSNGNYPGYHRYPGAGYGYGYGYGYGGKQQGNAKKFLAEIIDILRRHKLLVALITLLIFLMVAVFTFSRSPKYQTFANVEIDSGRYRGGNQALSYGYIDAAQLEVQDASAQAIVLQESIEIAEKTIERLTEEQNSLGDDINLTVLNPRNPSAVDKIIGFFRSADAPTNDLPDIVDRIQKDYLKVKVVGQGGVLKIIVESTDPLEAALIANIYAEEYVRLTETKGQETIRTSREFLEDQVLKSQTDVDQVNADLEGFVRSQDVVSLNGDAQFTVTQLARLEQELTEARVNLSMGQSALTKLKSELAGMGSGIQTGIASTLKDELDSVQESIVDLRKILGNIYAANPDYRENPPQDVADLVQQIEVQQARAQRIAAQYTREQIDTRGFENAEDPLAGARRIREEIEIKEVEVAGLRAKIAGVSANVREYNSRLRSVPEQQLGLKQLEGDQKARQERLQDLEKDLEEVRLAEQSQIGLATISRPATVPAKPIGPGDTFNLMMGLVLGLMLGAISAIVKAKLDTRIYAPDNVRDLGMNLLGAIPAFKEELLPQKQTSLSFGRSKKPKSFSDRPKDMKVGFAGRKISDTLVTLLQPASVISDAYRRLYLALKYSSHDDSLKTVLVTSPEAEVGKSTTALNLAIIAARLGKKTLIIDADLYRPALNDRLGVTSDVSFADVIAMKRLKVTYSEMETGIERLYALTMAKPIANAAEYLSMDKVGMVIEYFRERFDYIVIDSSPMLLTTGATVLSRMCDTTVIVVAAGVTDADAVLHVSHELSESGGVVGGVVLNRFDAGKSAGYKTTYGYRQNKYGKYYSGETV